MPSQPVIVGAGIAGLATALCLAPRPVTVISKGQLGSGATGWAQGGIAAAILPEDSTGVNAADTIRVGGGLVDPEIARIVAEAAPGAVARLRSWGVPFDLDADGKLMPGLEAGHSSKRIVHAGGDSTGHEIMAALVHQALRTQSIEVIENASVTELLVDDQGISGVAFMRAGQAASLATRCVVVATGGVGSLYLHTTNPPSARGEGLALAFTAGAAARDLEFVQFHPTALDFGRDPMPLATEALRGQGARLIDTAGNPVMAGEPAGDLSPRDVVARALWKRLRAGDRVFLDCRGIDAMEQRFPTVFASCQAVGIDPRVMPLRVRPAAHYHMGGIAVDECGRASIPGLWACGETASTGLHGANRLASNSLLEAVVFGARVAEALEGRDTGPARTPAQPVRPRARLADMTIRRLMDDHLGVTRDEAGLSRALASLAPAFLAGEANACVPFAIALTAWRRRESRGAHYRTDFPQADAEAVHSHLTLDDARAAAAQFLS